MFMCYHISNQLRPHSLPLRSLFSLVSAKAVRSIESSPSTALSLRHLSSMATVSPAMAVSTTGALFVAFSLVGLAMLSSFASLFVRFGLVLRGVSVPADEDCASEVLRFDPFFDFFIVVSGCVGSSVVSYVVVSAFVVVLHMWSIWRGCAFARCSLCTLLNCSRTAIINHSGDRRRMLYDVFEYIICQGKKIQKIHFYVGTGTFLFSMSILSAHKHFIDLAPKTLTTGVKEQRSKKSISMLELVCMC